mgnify:CR=1 FL=1
MVSASTSQPTMMVVSTTASTEGMKIPLIVLEDNQACIKVLEKGYSSKLRHVLRNHKVNIGSIHDTIS